MKRWNFCKIFSIRFTICHEHACTACPTHVCYCIWRKRVYVIANEGFGLGDGIGPAEESRGRNASRNGLVKLGWVHCLQYMQVVFNVMFVVYVGVNLQTIN